MTKRLTPHGFIVSILGTVIAFSNGSAIAQPQTNSSPQPLIDLSASFLPDSMDVQKSTEDLALPSEKGISLQQAMDFAMRFNRSLEQARLSLEKTQASYREQQASLYPNVEAVAQTNYDRRSLASSQNDDLVLSAGVQSNYTLFDFGQRTSKIRIQNAQVRTAVLEVNRLSQQIRQEVAEQYYDLQNSGEQVRINQSAVENSQKSFQDTVSRERVGLGTHFDTLQAQTQLSNDQVNLLQAQNDLKVSQRKLALKLGLAQTTQLSASDPIKVVGPWSLAQDQTILNAYAQRVELDQQRLAQKIGQLKVKLADTQNLPQVKLSAGYTLQASPLNDPVFSNPLQDDLSVSLKLNWTLFDGGAAKSQAAQAKADIAIAGSEFANRRDQIRVDVETGFLTLQSQQQQIEAAQVGLTSAQEQLRIARLRFDGGVGTQLDILNAQSKLAQAQSNVSKAVTGYNKAFAQLQRAMNQL